VTALTKTVEPFKVCSRSFAGLWCKWIFCLLLGFMVLCVHVPMASWEV